MPKIQIKYVPVVVKNKDEDHNEAELGPGSSTEHPLEKSNSDLRQVDYSSKQQGKYVEQQQQLQGTIYVPGHNSDVSAYSPNSLQTFPSQLQRSYSPTYRQRQQQLQSTRQENVYSLSQGRHSTSPYSVGHHLNHLDHVQPHDQGVFGVTTALNPQNIGIEYAG